MNEAAAKDVVMVRAIEIADRQYEILSQEDRQHASRSARELARWRASETGAEPTTEYFLQQRAGLILQRLAGRLPTFATLSGHAGGLRRLGVVLPCLALLAGAGLDRITDPHRVDLLSLPLLSIILWNLLAYVLLLGWFCLPRRGTGLADTALARKLAGGTMRLPRKLPPVLATGLSAYMLEWIRLSRPLTAARLAYSLHASAALFAIGAIGSLYARGVLSAYSAGWESTFLSVPQLHTLLSTIFAPARAVFDLADFSLADIESLRFAPNAAQILTPPVVDTTTAASSTLQAGARWVHLYAATILLLVIVPRSILAGLTRWRAIELARRFPLGLEQPYFRRLAGGLSGKPSLLRVLPYSFTVDEARDQGLTQVAAMLLGEESRVMLRPSSAYGHAAPERLGDAHPDLADVDLTAVLFNMAATPETQNHGEFLDQLSAQTTIVALVDQSGYRERLGEQAGSVHRLSQRVALWHQFCNTHGVTMTIVDLLDPPRCPLDRDDDTYPA
ncbi:MAG: DUF2868 domain-containing protein [Pseudomonadota bacterium]